MNNCTICDWPVPLSGHSYRKEAAVSGMCPGCQDAYFGKTAGEMGGDCGDCNGSGTAGGAKCQTCKGTGLDRCFSCGHLMGRKWDECLDDDGKSVDCDCGDDRLSSRTAAVEEFPVVEEATEEIESEPRLPDWIENSWA